jgi:hypothetical protein
MLLAVAAAAVILALATGLPLIGDRDGLAHAGREHPRPASRAIRLPHRSRQRTPARPPQAQPPPQAEVTVRARATTTPVPRSFFGLSTEYWSIPLYERHPALFARALSLLRVGGDGPPILRIGGDSADHAFWVPKLRRMPWWAFELTPLWVQQIGALVRRARLRLILDLNLITGRPGIAAQWARAAVTQLPHGSVVGFEVGNEPDLYAHWFWLESIGPSRLAASILPRALTAGVYTRDFRSYARALAEIAPSVPLAGPELANPARDAWWLTRLISGSHRGLGIISAHRYPFSACVKPGSLNFPTTARLLTDAASYGIARSVRGAVRAAHRADLPFRLTELNSVTCGGLRGVSNTFATALWAPDTLFNLLREGVDGVNVHMRANTVNAPFALGPRGFWARPLMYGLLMFARTLGPHPAFVRSHLRGRRSLHVSAWAVRSAGRVLHVLVIDKGTRPVRLELRLPARGPATVERLLAPSLGASTGVALAGQHLSAAATWVGPHLVETIDRGAQGYLLTVPRRSEALVAVRLASGALRGRGRRSPAVGGNGT